MNVLTESIIIPLGIQYFIPLGIQYFEITFAIRTLPASPDLN